MATPHVTGVAGLIFAANPDLTGADAKRILLASTYGRFYYTGGHSGMADAGVAVVNALLTREHSVNRVIKTDASDGLDVCFLVDTTGSMGDDISNAKQNMTRILDELAAKSDGFRVALIDYRDFQERAASGDYPAKIHLEFSNDKDEITAAINSLNLGNGGDDPETVYSGLMAAVGLGWRAASTKVVIVLGDAPPLDPEPYTGYTLNSVMSALYNADVKIDLDASDERVLGDSGDSLIKVYSIGAGVNSAAEDFFRQISDMTGGAYTGVESASDVSDAIIGSIEQIEIVPTKTVRAAFGDDFSGETIEIYQDGKFYFEAPLDESGSIKLENMEFDRYDWKIPRLLAGGTVKINESGRSAKVSFDDAAWYQPAVILWQRERATAIGCGAGGAALIIFIIAAVRLAKRLSRRRRQDKAGRRPEEEQAIQAEAIHAFYHGAGGAERPPAPQWLAPPEAPGESRVCRSCGARYDRPVKFCVNCGSKMEGGSAGG
jgi:Mg-chelatase subunit ChlD